MPNGSPWRNQASRLGATPAGVISLVAAIALAGCSHDSRTDDDGCTNDRDRNTAQTLAALPFITAHPDPAEIADQGSGCGANSEEVGAVREYYWENLNRHLVVEFHRAIAEKGGWKAAPMSHRAGQAESSAEPPALGSDDFLCFTKPIDGNAAFLQLDFPDSSAHGAEGNVYAVSAWIPGPTEPPGC